MRSSAPKVYSAINAVARELSRRGVGKLQSNDQDQYQYRGIDDVLNRLSPVLAQHKLCVLPRVLERLCQERNGGNGTLLISVSLKVAFDLVSVQDGSIHTLEAYGEALDGGDKATSKAMSAAFKYVLLQAFCVPVVGMEDADAKTHQLRTNGHQPEPVQGWNQWTDDILEIIRVCQTEEALERVQGSNRGLLKSISRERPDLYTRIGESMRGRRHDVAPAAPKPTSKANGLESHPRGGAAVGAGGAGV
jgi:hypothetical protein